MSDRINLLKEQLESPNMKALSIRQPWAWAISNGFKNVENRTWKTNYRGWFFVHASQTYEESAVDVVIEAIKSCGCSDRTVDRFLSESRSMRGGIVGVTKLIDCVQNYPSPWAIENNWHFVLEGSVEFEFYKLNGKLNFFNVGT